MNLAAHFSDPIWSNPSSQQMCYTATVLFFLEHLGKGHLLSRTRFAGLLGGWLSLKFFECFDLSTMLLDQGLDGPKCFGPQDMTPYQFYRQKKMWTRALLEKCRFLEGEHQSCRFSASWQQGMSPQKKSSVWRHLGMLFKVSVFPCQHFWIWWAACLHGEPHHRKELNKTFSWPKSARKSPQLHELVRSITCLNEATHFLAVKVPYPSERWGRAQFKV